MTCQVGFEGSEIVNLERTISLATIVVLLAGGENALARSSSSIDAPEDSVGAADDVGAPAPPPRWQPLSGFGMTVAGGGGVTDFTQSSIRGVTELGGSWNFRLAFGTRRLLGFEVSYVGGANAIRDLGGEGINKTLIRNGIESALRLNVPLYMKDTLLEPYFVGGLGWNGYRITDVMVATASVTPTNENALSVPLAAGFVVGAKGFIADVRCTVRPTYGQGTFRDEGTGALTNWDIGAMIGYEF